MYQARLVGTLNYHKLDLNFSLMMNELALILR